jgi:hypothetical protein
VSSGSTARAAIAGVLIPVGAFAIGVSLVHSLLILGAVLAAGAILGLIDLADAPFWPELQEGTRGGNRREIARLSWMLTSRRSDSDRDAILRLKAVASRRLAFAGIDLEDPADGARARAALGPSVHALLTEASGRAPQRRALAECVRALEALGEIPGVTSQSSTSRPPNSYTLSSHLSSQNLSSQNPTSQNPNPESPMQRKSAQ